MKDETKLSYVKSPYFKIYLKKMSKSLNNYIVRVYLPS